MTVSYVIGWAVQVVSCYCLPKAYDCDRISTSTNIRYISLHHATFTLPMLEYKQRVAEGERPRSTNLGIIMVLYVCNVASTVCLYRDSVEY